MASNDKKPATSISGGRPSGTIRTLADLNRRSGPHSDSDSDGPQEHFTGGQKSGMMVQDPSKNNDVDEIFNQARQHGAVEGSLENAHPSNSRTFTGIGRLLSGGIVYAPSQPPESVVHNIVFWRNGFTVNDGPLRRLDDPANAPFLESIRKSEGPIELMPADRRTSVHVSVTRRDENRPEPKKQSVAFQGVGRTLSGSNGTADSSSPEQPTSLTSVPPPPAGLTVDQSQPSTPIQLRLADGTRMVAHFNYSHTINDIRGFIDASRPGGSRTYQMQTGFPPKQLNDLNQTIRQAGLANSVVIQKL